MRKLTQQERTSFLSFRENTFSVELPNFKSQESLISVGVLKETGFDLFNRIPVDVTLDGGDDLL